MDGAAKALGMNSGDLRTALQGGQSLATIAQSKGLTLDTVIAAMASSIQQANPTVSAEQATRVATAMATHTPPTGATSAPQNSADQVQGTSGTTSIGGHHGHHRHHAISAAMDSVANLLGTTTSDLTTATQNGQSLTSTAASKGISQTDLVNAITTALQGADSNLSADQAKQLATSLATGTPPGNQAQPWAAGTGTPASTFSVGA
jgi:hypothetical protein